MADVEHGIGLVATDKSDAGTASLYTEPDGWYWLTVNSSNESYETFLGETIDEAKARAKLIAGLLNRCLLDDSMENDDPDLPSVGVKVEVLLSDGRVVDGSVIRHSGRLAWFVDGFGIADDECVLGWREIS